MRPAVLVFLTFLLTVLGPFHLHINFSFSLSISTDKRPVLNWDYYWINLGRIDNFVFLSLVICEEGTFFHLCRSSPISVQFHFLCRRLCCAVGCMIQLFPSSCFHFFCMLIFRVCLVSLWLFFGSVCLRAGGCMLVWQFFSWTGVFCLLICSYWCDGVWFCHLSICFLCVTHGSVPSLSAFFQIQCIGQILLPSPWLVYWLYIHLLCFFFYYFFKVGGSV